MVGRRGHWRRDKSLQRRPGKRLARPIFLVVCEGETEQEYIEALKRAWRVNTTQVRVADNTVGSDPLSVVKCGEDLCKDFPYDKVFCVFDRDSHATYGRALERIAQLSTRPRDRLPILDVRSVPCVELWFLLHFEYSTREHPDFASIRPEVSRHLPGYQKADRAIAEALVARVEVAEGNAQRLERAAVAAGFDNPFTNFHRLVQMIREMVS
jgi:hypothetical protein